MKRLLTITVLSAVGLMMGASLAWAAGGGETGTDTTVAGSGVSATWIGDLPGVFNLDEYESLTGRKITAFGESPLLAERVANGQLPPVEQRLPTNPLVVEPWEQIGQYGGTIRNVHSGDIAGDTRHMLKTPLLTLGPSSAYMHYSLVGGPVRPGVFESWSVSENGKDFTFTIRNGLKWSDGVPVTTDDVRYAYKHTLRGEEFAKELMTPTWAVWGGSIFDLEVVDDSTFRARFAEPYGSFPTQILRGGSWHLLMRPAHYLEQFDLEFTTLESLQPMMQEHGFDKDDWDNFFQAVIGDWSGSRGGAGHINAVTASEYPMLDPWLVVSNPKPGEHILERNPYFYMVDTQGNQLPYIDGYHRDIVSDIETTNLKIIAGETDFQTKFLKLSDFPLYMENRDRGGYEVMLLPTADVQPLQIILNLTPTDPVMAEIVQDRRFRQAMSLALNREEMIELIFLGNGRPANVTSAKGTDFYVEEYEQAFIEFDPERANALLDEMGLGWDNNRQFRLRPDGKRLTLPLVYYEVMAYATPGAEAASRYLTQIGIDTPVKQVSGSFFWQMWGNRDTWMSVWMRGGDILAPWWETGLSVTASAWWEWYQSRGASGQEPTPAAKRLYELRDVIQRTSDPEERTRAGQEMYQIQAENVWEMGVAAGVPLPFVYSRKLGNIGLAEEKQFLLTNPVATSAVVQWFFKE